MGFEHARRHAFRDRSELRPCRAQDHDEWGSDGIDDEGTPTQRTTIVEDGKLVSYLYDLLRARKDGVASTGNGRRESFRHLPVPRMTNTYFGEGNATPEEQAHVASTYRMVQRIPVGQRVAWVLRHIEGETLDSIAGLCNCSKATVQRRLRAAERSLEASRARQAEEEREEKDENEEKEGKPEHGRAPTHH